jgi:hypothetical protein
MPIFEVRVANERVAAIANWVGTRREFIATQYGLDLNRLAGLSMSPDVNML